MRTRRELAEFVASLPIPKERREVVQLELEDHVFEGIAELEASGVPSADAERRSVESLGAPAELGAQLVAAQLAWSISTRRAVALGTRTGLLVAAITLVAGYFDDNPGWAHPMALTDVDWLAPSPLYYVVTALALIAALPRSVIRPFLAVQRHAVIAHRAGNAEAVKRLQEPAASFLAALMTAGSSPFLLWIVGTGVGIPFGALEGPILRTITAAFVINVSTIAVASIAVLQASPEEARRRGRLA